jgi:serine/threonine-protein kinase
VFALGVLVHEMVAGKLPVAGAAGAGWPAGVDASSIPGLAELVGRMLDPDPTGRPRDAGEVVAALDALVKRARESRGRRASSRATPPAARSGRPRAGR